MSAVTDIRAAHRKRRFAMKVQSKLDRALEAYVRVNFLDWNWELPEAERAKLNAKAKTMIKQARAADAPEELVNLVEIVLANDTARAPMDKLRKDAETEMETLAEELPVFAWWDEIKGIGPLGLATIIAETGDLSGYETKGHIWKRLGFAPYDGFAGSTWKRQSWRPRTLSATEWTENPFSGERYSFMQQIAENMLKHQLISKTKTESGRSEAKGPYGAKYVHRYSHTLEMHPDWTDGHRNADAIRYAMKCLLADLWRAWRDVIYDMSEETNDELHPADKLAA